MMATRILISLLATIVLCSAQPAVSLGGSLNSNAGVEGLRRALAGENEGSRSRVSMKELAARRKSKHVSSFLQHRRTQNSVFGSVKVGTPRDGKGKKGGIIQKSDGKDTSPIVSGKNGKGAAPVFGGKGKKGSSSKKAAKSSSSKGKGKGKGKGNSKSPSKSSKKGNKFCQDFTFTDHRRLQNEGEDCSPNVLDVARENPELSIFVDLVERSGLEEIFNCPGPFTVLPPYNDAFLAIDPAILAQLLLKENREHLQELLLYHILPGVFLEDDFEAGVVETLNGEVVVVTENPLRINEASIIDPDVLGCNGMLQIIDEILVPLEPPNICEEFNFNGDDRNLDCEPNILNVARANPDLSSILSLIEAAGLEEIFERCSGPFTLLLPDNAAVEALGSDTLEALLDPENFDILQDLIFYHTVPALVPSSNLEEGPLETLFTPADVLVFLDPIMFNSANALSLDTSGCNGLYDMIDEVLVPGFIPPTPSPTLAPTIDIFCAQFDFGGTINPNEPNILEVAKENLQLSLMVSLFEVSGLDEIFRCPGPFTALMPTNEAFMNVDPARLEFLMEPENIQELQGLLFYHVLPGQTLIDDFTAGPTDTLLPGFPVDVSFTPDIMFDEGSVEVPDVPASNGVFDVLDTLLDPFFEPPAPTVAPTIDLFCAEFDFGGDRDPNSPNILDVARENPDLSVAVSLFDYTSLNEVLECPGPFTSNLPNNDAFLAMDPKRLEFLTQPENINELREVLLFHILPGETLTNEFTAGPHDTLLPDFLVEVSVDPLMFDDASVVDPDTPASNGVFNIIDTVLDPFVTATPSPTGAPTVDPFCIEFDFGGTVTPNEANILEVAREDPELSIIVSLFESTDLDAIFDCPGSFTANFPTNTAFSNMDEDRVDFLTQPENIDELRSLLLYHVIPGLTLASDFTAGPVETLFSGNDVEVSIDPLMFDFSGVDSVDTPGSNGVYNTIDRVLDPFVDPPAPTSTPSAEPSGMPSATPSGMPSATPSAQPTGAPVSAPTSAPTLSPSGVPSGVPSSAPISVPTGVPSASPSSVPSSSPIPEFVEVRVNDFFISYVSGGTVEPTPEEYQALVDANIVHYTELYAAQFASDPNIEFVSLDLVLRETRFGTDAGEPSADFTIHMEYEDAILTFLGTSVGIPSPNELYFTIRDGITQDYLLDTVRQFTGTAFAQVIEGYTERLATQP